MDTILKFFADNFGGFVWLAVLFVAMLPIAEAKVAIPFAMSYPLWGQNTLSPVVAGVLGFVGSMIPAFFIIPFLKPVFAFLKRSKVFKNTVVFFETKFKKQAQKQFVGTQSKHRTLVYSSNTTTGSTGTIIKNDIYVVPASKKTTKLWQMLTLLFFVAIPLPLAGVWTSSAIAAFGDMKYGPSLLSIAIGNLMEVIFVTVLCVLLVDSVFIILIATLILVLFYIGFMILLNYLKKQKQKAKN